MLRMWHMGRLLHQHKAPFEPSSGRGLPSACNNSPRLASPYQGLGAIILLLHLWRGGSSLHVPADELGLVSGNDCRPATRRWCIDHWIDAPTVCHSLMRVCQQHCVHENLIGGCGMPTSVGSGRVGGCSNAKRNVQLEYYHSYMGRGLGKEMQPVDYSWQMSSEQLEFSEAGLLSGELEFSPSGIHRGGNEEVMFRNLFQLYRRLLEADDSEAKLRFFDVGCAHGNNAELWLDIFSPLGFMGRARHLRRDLLNFRIDCFEPDVQSHGAELRSKFSNSSLVTVHFVAVGEDTSSRSVTLQRSGFMTIMPEDAHKAAGRAPAVLQFVSVDSFSRAQAIERVHVLKIDCEGFDPQVLTGSKEILTRGIDIVIFEYSLAWLIGNDPSLTNLCSISGWLSELGYDTFLMGRRNLLQLNDECWVHSYESWVYANIVAIWHNYVHAQKLVDAYNLDFPYRSDG